MKKILIILIMFFSFLLNVKANDLVKESNECVTNFLLYGGNYYYDKCNELIKQLPTSNQKSELQEKISIKYQEEQQIIKEKNKNEFWIFIIIIIILISITLIIYFKYDREYKSTFNEKYLRDIPNDYNLIAVSYLMDKKINKHCISAILLDLIRRKLILLKKDGKEIILKKNTNMDKLNEVEKNVINLFFNNHKEINIKEIKRRKNKTYLNNLNKFLKIAKTEALNYNFYEKDKENKKANKFYIWLSSIIITILILILNPLTTIFLVPVIIALYSDNMGRTRKVCIGIVFVIILQLFFEIDNLSNFNWNLIYWKYLFAFMIIICVLIQSYIIRAHKKNKEYVNEYHKWLAFKNFIRDFGVFEIRNIEDIYLREKYLVYATLFGYSKKISKDVNFKVDENDLLALNIIYNNVFDVNVIPLIISSILYKNDDY